MKTPPINHSNILRIYKSDWFVTETEIADIKKSYVFQDIPVHKGDIYGGLFLGIHVEDFEKFAKGAPKYRAIAICDALNQKLK